MTIEAIIFDMDGLLVDSEPTWDKARVATDGDVVFKVTIQLDEQPEALLWGMSADAEINVVE